MNLHYINKTFNRLDKLRDDMNFGRFFLDDIYINNKKYSSLNEYVAALPSLVEKLVIDTFDGSFNIIHGDLCFANILIEDTYNFIRIIDPRGKFGEYDIYGDGRYEIAKLMHTLEGKYDVIIDDMFSIAVDGNKITYTPKKNFDNILKVFKDVFSEKLKDEKAVRLIEATLFLGMIPLHSDYSKRQYAMLATGVMLLDSVMNS